MHVKSRKRPCAGAGSEQCTLIAGLCATQESARLLAEPIYQSLSAIKRPCLAMCAHALYKGNGTGLPLLISGEVVLSCICKALLLMVLQPGLHLLQRLLC